MRTISIQSGVFKAKCLQLMDEVKETNLNIIITKHGKPVAKLVPLDEQAAPDFFGCLQNTVVIKENILDSLDESWGADE